MAKADTENGKRWREFFGFYWRQQQSKLARYGLTLDEYIHLWQQQAGRCAICEKDHSSTHSGGTPWLLSVDHCHKTGRIRSLLCNQCNVGMGLFQDDPALLEAAADYLERFL